MTAEQTAVLAEPPAVGGENQAPQAGMPADAASHETVGELMSMPIGVFRRDMTVAQTVEALREQTRAGLITYCYITEETGELEGLVVMRDMLLSDPETRLESIMIPDPFRLGVDMPLKDALKAALAKHFPVYPVCDSRGVLKGLIRGDELFAEQAIEISAQAGKMVGVEKEERLTTPLKRSLLLRHPWLQLNLFTAFIAAGVVGIFENTLDQLVILAVFLPVLAGQSGNTGCQALAVTLRGMTLGDLQPGSQRSLIAKEGFLGLCNGLLVGLTAAIGMFAYATMQGQGEPFMLAGVVMFAMVVSCVSAGLAGALIPLGLQRLGADPATASSIFLTTASDVVSMGVFLSVATMLLL